MVLLCTHNCIFYPVSCQERPLVAKKNLLLVQNMFSSWIPVPSYPRRPLQSKIDQCGLSKVLLCK